MDDIRTRPQKKWTTVAELGNKGGGLNGGIVKVKDSSGNIYIEKRFRADDVKYRLAQKEVVLLKQLSNHKYITRMVDHYIDELGRRGSVYLEFCSEGSLMDLTRKRQKDGRYVKEIKVWNWFMQIMDALSYIHFGPDPDNKTDRNKKRWNEIWHRDIKPANILLGRADNGIEIVAKLADFGCSVSYASNWESKSRARDAAAASAYTQGFQPPEFPNYTSRSDVWQLAACMICLCRLQTSPGSDGNSKYPAGRKYSKELNDAIALCMSHQDRRPLPDKALQHLKAMYEELEPSLSESTRPVASPIPDYSRESLAQAPMSSPWGRPNQGRPRGLAHASSAPEVPRRNNRRDLYRDYMRDQRSPRLPPWDFEYSELDGW